MSFGAKVGNLGRKLFSDLCLFLQSRFVPQVVIPTTYWEPHREWQDGPEPHEGISAHDLARQEDGYWSEEDFFAYEPQIPAVPVKRWRGPQGTEHTDQAPHLMHFSGGDRVV